MTAKLKKKKMKGVCRSWRRRRAALPGGGKYWLLTTGGNLVSRVNVQCLLTRSNMVSWSLYYTAVGHHVNPGIIHHTQECTHTHANTHEFNHRFVIVKAVEHLVCLKLNCCTTS